MAGGHWALQHWVQQHWTDQHWVGSYGDPDDETDNEIDPVTAQQILDYVDTRFERLMNLLEGIIKKANQEEDLYFKKLLKLVEQERKS
jgi:hypothetical protein